MACSNPRISPRSPTNSEPPTETFRRQSSDSYQTIHSETSDASTANLHHPSGTYAQPTPKKLAIEQPPAPRRWRFVVWESKPTWYRCVQLFIVLTVLILDITAIRKTIFTPTSNAFLLAVCCITCINLLYRIVIDRLLAVRLNVGWAQRMKNMWIPPVCEGLNCLLFLVGWIWIAIEVFGKGGKCEIGGGSRHDDRDGPTPEEEEDGDDGDDHDDDNEDMNEPTTTAQNIPIPSSTVTTTTTKPTSTANLTESPSEIPTTTEQTSLATQTLPPGTDGDDDDGNGDGTTPPVVDDGTNTPPVVDDGNTPPPVDDDTNNPPPVVDESDTESEDNGNLKNRRKNRVKRRRVLNKGKRNHQTQAGEDNSKRVLLPNSEVESKSKIQEPQITVIELALRDILREGHQPQPTKPVVLDNAFSVPPHKEQEWHADLLRRDQSVHPSSLDGVDCGVESTILGLGILMWFSFAVGLVTVVREMRENLEVLKARRRERQAAEA